MISFVLLENEFVSLKPIDAERDSTPLYQIYLDKNMHLYTGNSVPKSKEEIYSLINNYENNEDIWAWAVYDKKTNEFIGTYWIAIPTLINGSNIITAEAQRIGTKYWRKGYTKAARRLLYDYCFNTLNVDAIYAQAWMDNKNSCISMEIAGFMCYEQVTRYYDKYKKDMLENHYILMKEVWRSKT